MYAAKSHKANMQAFVSKFVYVTHTKTLYLHNPSNARYVWRESKLMCFIGAQELGLAPESQVGCMSLHRTSLIQARQPIYWDRGSSIVGAGRIFVWRSRDSQATRGP
jgi:hypothetical protein